eukprot:scaffold69762_cov70-Phaeocystis_antarctica.AAC.1
MNTFERTVARPRTRRGSQQSAPSSLTRAGAALGRRDLRASPRTSALTPISSAALFICSRASYSALVQSDVLLHWHS